MLIVLYIGDKLRETRKRALLTQQQLADKSGMGVTTIIRVERNQVEPQARTIRKLAEALGVEPHELLKGEDGGEGRQRRGVGLRGGARRPAAPSPTSCWKEKMVGRRGNGEGSVYRRKNGTWAAQYTVWTAEGRKRRSVAGKTRAEVSRKLMNAMADRDG